MIIADNLDPQTPFTDLLKFIQKFNEENPSNIQPITDEILSALNELGGIGQSNAWKDAGWLNIHEYDEDYSKLNNLLNTQYILDLTISFGKDVLPVKSSLLNAQIQAILKKHLKRSWPVPASPKRGPGQPSSRWLRTYSEGQVFIDKLRAAGITDIFLAHFFNRNLETFKRKIPK